MKIDEEVLNKIKELKKEGKTALYISEQVNLPTWKVYKVFHEYNLGYKLNTPIEIDYLTNQIILSGILGDGRIKQNGKSNCYYSECHAMGEKDYCEWKMLHMGDLTKNTQLYEKNRHNDSCNAVEFTTKTTPSLNKYKDMKYDLIPVINQLEKEGLVLYLLDDGWKAGNGFGLATGHLSDEVRTAIINRYNDVFHIDCRKSGIKNVDVYFPVSSTQIIFDWIKETNFLPFELDIMQKKFKDRIVSITD